MGVYPGYAGGGARGAPPLGWGDPGGGAAGYVLREVLPALPPLVEVQTYLGFQITPGCSEATFQAEKDSECLVKI